MASCFGVAGLFEGVDELAGSSRFQNAAEAFDSSWAEGWFAVGHGRLELDMVGHIEEALRTGHP